MKVLEQDNGQYNVFIGTGQSLVLGDGGVVQVRLVGRRPTRKAMALVGLTGNVAELGDNVFTGGSLGGLMAFRNETLIATQNAIGRLAMALGSSFNDQHKLGVDLNGVLGTDFFWAMDGDAVPNDLYERVSAGLTRDLGGTTTDH